MSRADKGIPRGPYRLKHQEIGREQGIKESDEKYKKKAHYSIAGGVIGGLFWSGKILIEHGSQPDLALGFVAGLLVGTAIGFGFGILIEMNNR